MWNFAIINDRLAEIYYEDKRGKRIFGAHCYVKESDYKTKWEKRAIKEDTKRAIFSYRKGIYKDKITGKTYPQSKNWLEPVEKERGKSLQELLSDQQIS